MTLPPRLLADAELAARDTTFDDVFPDRVWITFNNRKRKGAGLTVTLEINGVEKEINAFVYYDDGHILCSHNLTWILEPLKAKLLEQEQEITALRSAKASKDIYCDQIEKEMSREIARLKLAAEEWEAECVEMGNDKQRALTSFQDERAKTKELEAEVERLKERWNSRTLSEWEHSILSLSAKCDRYERALRAFVGIELETMNEDRLPKVQDEARQALEGK